MTALGAAVILLAVGSAIVYPFEMDTVVSLSDGRLVATHYGLYNTVSGLGITLGNLATGAIWDYAHHHQAPCLSWLGLTATGLTCAATVHTPARTGRLAPPSPSLPPPPRTGHQPPEQHGHLPSFRYAHHAKATPPRPRPLAAHQTLVRHLPMGGAVHVRHPGARRGW
ncbi:hypothetical protein AB0P15_37780 [Streptomyces sp. NPDC087917]|uniref:hypothetical protein n=1 Tax=Streptomyces sp. NPDC087917 TaxID=3155060 RepID=UPI003439978A